MCHSFLKKLEEFWFPTISGRVLALIRIFLATAMIYDTFTFLPARDSLFGLEGILGEFGSRRPYSTLTSFIESFGGHVPALDPTGLNILFAIYIYALLMLLVGYYHRFAALLVWIIYQYFMMRNYIIFDGGNSLASILLFFIIFLPADATLSLRTWIREKSWQESWKEKVIESAWALRLIQIQICIVYMSAFWYKTQGETWLNGSAVYYATRLPIYVNPDFAFLFEGILFIKMATYATLALEISFPILIWFRRTRIWILTAATLFHLVLEFSLVINIFQWVMIAGLLSFLPPEIFNDRRNRKSLRN